MTFFTVGSLNLWQIFIGKCTIKWYLPRVGYCYIITVRLLLLCSVGCKTLIHTNCTRTPHFNWWVLQLDLLHGCYLFYGKVYLNTNNDTKWNTWDLDSWPLNFFMTSTLHVKTKGSNGRYYMHKSLCFIQCSNSRSLFYTLRASVERNVLSSYRFIISLLVGSCLFQFLAPFSFF